MEAHYFFSGQKSAEDFVCERALENGGCLQLTTSADFTWCMRPNDRKFKCITSVTFTSLSSAASQSDMIGPCISLMWYIPRLNYRHRLLNSRGRFEASGPSHLDAGKR